ncbi:MAG: polysaccharide deacetylase family protein [Candidatus Cloacimonetes bacterium]|nr:polysaccharide deacetylase family protein [Candidatus Cloacimonadota bacterium]
MSLWFNDLRDATGEKVLKEGMPILLDLYRRYNVKSTFFFTGYIVDLYPDVVRMILRDGHEVGSHGKSHIPENGFDVMPFNKQKAHLDYSKKQLEDVSGTEVISFRAPALQICDITARALIETGFRIDSSIAPQRFDFFMSFGSKQKLRFLTARRLPYRTKLNNIYAKGNSPLIEVPISGILMPFVGTTMRIFPWVTRIQKTISEIETKMFGKPIVLVVHPNEFIDESDEVRVVSRRSNNVIGHILKDLIRSKLKVRNLGAAAIPLYESVIKHFSKKGYNLSTMSDYVKHLIDTNRI